MPGPVQKSGYQKRKEKKRRELARAFDPQIKVINICFQSTPKEAPSQAAETSSSSHDASQEEAS